MPWPRRLHQQIDTPLAVHPRNSLTLPRAINIRNSRTTIKP